MQRIAHLAFCLAILIAASAECAELRGRVLDAKTGQPLAARIYLTTADGKSLHVDSQGGNAVNYEKIRSRESAEVHTSITAHPFHAKVPIGKLRLVVERGKEYHTATREIDVRKDVVEVVVRLQRWIDMSQLGWYSGETHVHRTLAELPTAMLAEDLNVGLPLTYWVTRSHTPPTQGKRNTDLQAEAKLIELDKTHVIYPLNTEYEIFSVGAKRHTLGAIFALNHQRPLKMGAPPVTPIADEIRKQGGLLELDKHNWPWSMMLPPTMKVDLYELTNNHIWRTGFLYREFGVGPADYMRAEKDPRGGVSERGWIQYTFENYYALLNCGLRMQPTAGCASGVHPVPLGFGRVYVHQPKGFDYQGWMTGLAAGRSFVTTGPMMEIRFDGQLGGGPQVRKRGDTVRVQGWIESPHPLGAIEILNAGIVERRIKSQSELTSRGSYRMKIDAEVAVDGATWLAVRCFARTPSGRPRFAHTSPHHIQVSGDKLRPRPEQAEFLVQRVQAEIERNREVLSESELMEFYKALAYYQQFLPAKTK